jgi:uncharacterized membrane protein YeaQ/YmgE (transglycosylase-associated protein family)
MGDARVSGSPANVSSAFATPSREISLGQFASVRDEPGGATFSSVTLGSLLVLLVIAGICGAIGRSIAGGSRSGCLGSIALGFIGALLGSWLARQLRLPEIFVVDVGTERFPVVWSIIGAALFVAVLGLILRRRG